MQAKGLGDAVAVFELVARGAARTALEVAAARGFSRFVGRDREMAVLEGAFAQARDGKGQVVGVVAEPGVGKSRLCHEFAERCRAQGIDVFAAHGLSHARSVAFVPVLELLRAQFGITEQDDSAAARTRIAGTVRELDASLDESLPLLFDFLGVADPKQPLAAIDPEAGQRRIFGALSRLRRARSAQAPFVIIAEDLHWLDPGSEAFLENLAGGVPGTRLLVVATFRPEYRPSWAHRSHYYQLPLVPLGAEASEELLRELLGPDPSLDGVAELVRERTAGNPFLIEEVVRGLVEAGNLAGRRGAYRLANTIDQVRIPATVQAVLAARVDRLAEHDKAVLQTAAVIGRQFSRRLLGRVSGLADDELQTALATLMEAELVYETTPEDEYSFKHALTEEVAYGSQLAMRRAGTHAAVARALVELDSERLDERASLIAHHFERGGELLEAAGWHARAAVWAGTSQPVEATRHWRRVRALLDELGASPETAQLGINARLQLLNLHWRLGAASEEGELPFEGEAAAVFAEAERFADATGQVAVKAMALGAYGAVRHLIDAPLQEAYELCIGAARLADETGEPGLRASVRVGVAWALSELGRVRDAAAVAREMVQIIGDGRWIGQGIVVTSPYAWCRTLGAFFTAHCERVDDGLSGLERGMELAAEEGDDETQAWGHRCWTMLADLAGGDPEAAAAHAFQGLRWAEEAGSQYSRIVLRQAVAISHAQRGEWNDAVETVAEALTIVRDRRMGLVYTPLLLATRARAELGAGDVSGSQSTTEEAIALARRFGTRGYEALARLQLARAYLAEMAAGNEGAARAELEEALSIVQTLGIRAYAPQIHLERARLARTVGDELEYDRELRTAHRLFLGIGAPARAEEVALLVQSR